MQLEVQLLSAVCLCGFFGKSPDSGLLVTIPGVSVPGSATVALIENLLLFMTASEIPQIRSWLQLLSPGRPPSQAYVVLLLS